MPILRKKADTLSVLKQIKEYDGNEIELLVALVNSLRPEKKIKESANSKIDKLISFLESEQDLLENLKKYLDHVFQKKKITNTLTDSNLISGINFWGELLNRFFQKILPVQPDKNTVDYILTNVFYQESDAQWINAVDNEKIGTLIKLLNYSGFYELPTDHILMSELLYSTDVLTHRIAGNAFDANVIKLVPEYATLNSPFAALLLETGIMLKDIETSKMQRSKDELQYKQVNVLLKQCFVFVQKAYANIPKYGISFSAHQQLMLIERLLERMVKVLDFIFIDYSQNSRIKLAEFIKTIIGFNSGKSKLSGYLNKSTQNISKEITRNIGEKGEYYITTNKTEYWKMFRTALGGGFIVALACIVKMNLTNLDVSLFGKAFLFSMNYAAAFIGIYLLHFTLATKQPAMTAATLAQAIENDIKNNTSFENLSNLVARIWRSQFIAFVGNVFMAFPVALGLLMLWGLIFDTNPAEVKAYKLINELDIFSSPAIFHAAIAGVFLFISGLIAGHVSNRAKYNNIAIRVKEHPVLRQLLSEKIRIRIAGFIDRNIGGIASNFWFGVFMGSTSTVGIILGFDLDIRHITFAAGNLGLGLYGLDFRMAWDMVLISVVGVGVIGFVNFIVSFTLSLLLALRSRGIAFKSMKIMVSNIRMNFFKNPLSYFYPPKDVRNEKVVAEIDKTSV